MKRTAGVFLAIFCMVALCGCFPAGSRGQDEEKEAHFLVGKSRVNAMDFKGAIESFQRALEVNPRSAAAHLELGMLLAKRESDPAAAIYHYQQYLRLRPGADNAGLVSQQIQVLKQDLAKNVLPPALTPELQRRYEQLADENQRLKEEVEKWRAYYARTATSGPDTLPHVAPDRTAQATPSPTPTPTPAPQPTTQRTHKVQSGDTPSSIARKYGVKLDALMAANPGLNPTRMQVGQTINVPVQ
ncbi:MAG TPA: LysM peptidoglycan-binding domain-containing protein [Verrucomicrobiota bacterium]|nr:LysM peptidoglycan-binding domain-containing protein [Verrucomicrobiota bacterium]